jgi:D-alanyl-D-alanine carboxypeptidase (penicillin-binding protein 5/6)
VGLRQVVLPVAGVQYNTNGLLGHDGIVGIKTGSTGQANGCLVFVAHAQAAGRMRTLYGAVFGVKPAPGQGWLTAVSLATAKLLPAVTASIRPVKVLSPGTQAARVVAPWGASTPALATKGVTLVGWPGLPVRITPVPSSKLSPTMPPNVDVGQGRVQVGAQEATVGLRTTRPIKGPTLRWKLGQV